MILDQVRIFFQDKLTGHEKSRIKNYFIGPNLVKSPIKIPGHGRKIGAMLWILILLTSFEKTVCIVRTELTEQRRIVYRSSGTDKTENSMNGYHEFDQKKCQTNGDIILFERTSNRIFTCKNVYLSLYQTEVLAFSVKK